jgi:hypothetical protein
MATSSVQGFVKSANLKENELDRQALNNLGTAPIADDISLFINNLKNESRLLVLDGEYDIITGLVTIVNDDAEIAATRSAVYTNGDRVRIELENGTLIQDNLYIAQSDGEFTFGFATDENLQNQFIFTPSTNFVVIRNNAVLLENLEKLGLQQTTASLSTGINNDDAGLDDGSGVEAAEEEDTYSFRFNEIYEYLDIAKFQAQSKFVNDKDVAADVDFAMEGMFTIRDPSDIIISTGITDNTPGLYITDPTSDVRDIQKIRAFSDTFNPWEDTVSALTTLSLDVTTGTLKLNQGIEIQGITPIEEIGTVDDTAFTHKIKVNIDGIDYYLCLNQT